MVPMIETHRATQRLEEKYLTSLYSETITPHRKTSASLRQHVKLTEEVFGQYFDEQGQKHTIRRFTWRNQNNIQVQVINFGARITSIKLPDRKGALEDIVLGFDDLAGYIYYQQHYFGACVGRTTNKIRCRVFNIGNQCVRLSGNEHTNGGKIGFDQKVFETYVTGNKVIMSHLSPHLEQGYPGDLLVRIRFELSEKNELKIDFEAQCTKPTIVDLSNLLYFNLAGHHTGPDEIYNHMITFNCNCFTPMNEGTPTGKICNVLNTEYDFQIPKLLGKIMGVQPHDGFDQNLCVNRGVCQKGCFVGRAYHPPSGRMLEVYSNQPGVQFKTGNNFGSGYVLTIDEILRKSEEPVDISETGNMLKLFKYIYTKLTNIIEVDRDTNYTELIDLITKIKKTQNECCENEVSSFSIELNPLQADYLTQIAAQSQLYNADTDVYSKLRRTINIILRSAVVREKSNTQMHAALEQKTKVPTHMRNSTTKDGEKQKLDDTNKIPQWYKKSPHIVGKSRVVYRTHGGIAIQTQNYPSSINNKNFPSPILNPGEIYEHNIVYRFWIRAGNPQKWIKRNQMDAKKRAKTH